jgi:hypothetical protein
MAAKNGHTNVLRLLASACPVPTDGADHQFDDGDVGAGPLYYVDEKGSTLLHAAANSHAVAQVSLLSLLSSPHGYVGGWMDGWMTHVWWGHAGGPQLHSAGA